MSAEYVLVNENGKVWDGSDFNSNTNPVKVSSINSTQTVIAQICAKDKSPEQLFIKRYNESLGSDYSLMETIQSF